MVRFGEREPAVDGGRELHLEYFLSVFSDEAMPPSEGTLLLPSIDNLDHSRRFNVTQKEARNIFRQLAACKPASQDRKFLRHADFLGGLRTFPKLASRLGLPEHIRPSGGYSFRLFAILGVLDSCTHVRACMIY